MRDPKRIDRMLALVRQVWTEAPDWRLCQLLINVARSVGWEERSVFYFEDDELEDALENLLEDIREERGEKA